MSYLTSLENEVMAGWRAKSRNALYRTDPEAWLWDVLRLRWHAKQREVVEGFLNNRRTAVKSANGTGKTRLFGELAMWGITTHDIGELLIIASSPSATQLKDGLFGYVDSNINRARGNGFMVPGYLTDMPTWAHRATTTSKAKTLMRGRTPPRMNIVGTFQGIRAIAAETDTITWVLIDEGGAVHDDLYVAAEAVTTGAGDNKIGVIGNPDSIGTQFQKMFEDDEVSADWSTHTISAFDLPTFTGEKVYDDPEMQRMMLSSGMIDPEWVAVAKRQWGEDSARYASKVLGEFPDSADYSFFSMSCINLAENTTVIPDYEEPAVLGVDLADNEGLGDDSKAFLNRGGEVQKDEAEEAIDHTPVRGARIRHVATWSNGRESANRIHEAAVATEAAIACIDRLGVGAGPTAQVEARPDRTYTVVGIKNSEKSPDPSRWANYRAYSYDMLREGMMNGQVDLDFKEEGPSGERIGKALRDQLLGIRYDFNSKGAIQIEPKKDARKRGVSSPDDLDAVVMSYGAKARSLVEDPLTGREGETALYDPYELEGLEMAGAGMPL